MPPAWPPASTMYYDSPCNIWPNDAGSAVVVGAVLPLPGRGKQGARWPLAATWRICGRTRTHSGRGQMTQGSPCVPLSGRGWGPMAPAAQFRRCCAACGQKVKTRRAGTVQRPLGQHQLQRKSASRKSVFGSLGAFNFSTRIKGRRRFTDIGPVTQSRRAGRWSWTI